MNNSIILNPVEIDAIKNDPKTVCIDFSTLPGLYHMEERIWQNLFKDVTPETENLVVENCVPDDRLDCWFFRYVDESGKFQLNDPICVKLNLYTSFTASELDKKLESFGFLQVDFNGFLNRLDTIIESVRIQDGQLQAPLSACLNNVGEPLSETLKRDIVNAVKTSSYELATRVI